MYIKILKPLLDFFISLLALLILSPLFLVITLLLTISNSGRPFFSQTRPGKNARLFNVIKFKTMNENKDLKGNLLPDKDRLTSVGRFIRSTSLDELPQLINVLKGDMSIVGPRPLMPHYLPLYNKEQTSRHNVKPGITGWAQINGRNSISWKEKFELDVWYVDNVSFLVDIKILFLTTIKVLKKEGINLNKEVSALPFNGNN